MLDFKGQVVVVSGAAGDLGGAVAHAFAGCGARLGLLDRRPGRLQEVCGSLAENPEHMLLGTVDMTDESAVRTAVDRILGRFGRIDVLVNAIGAFRAGEPVHKTSLQTWEMMLTVNARSVFLSCREVIPSMLEHGRGKIINISARPGLEASTGNVAYAASKSAVLRITEGLAAELKAHGIHANCVIPGTLDTKENRQAMPEADHEPWVTPAQVTSVILFLASEEAGAIHGAAVPVYGES